MTKHTIKPEEVKQVSERKQCIVLYIVLRLNNIIDSNICCVPIVFPNMVSRSLMNVQQTNVMKYNMKREYILSVIVVIVVIVKHFYLE